MVGMQTQRMIERTERERLAIFVFILYLRCNDSLPVGRKLIYHRVVNALWRCLWDDRRPLQNQIYHMCFAQHTWVANTWKMTFWFWPSRQFSRKQVDEVAHETNDTNSMSEQLQFKCNLFFSILRSTKICTVRDLFYPSRSFACWCSFVTTSVMAVCCIVCISIKRLIEWKMESARAHTSLACCCLVFGSYF